MLTPVTSLEEMRRLTGDDAWVRHSMPRSLAPGTCQAFRAGDALVVLTEDPTVELWVVPVDGEPPSALDEGCRALAASELSARPDLVGINVPRGSEHHLPPPLPQTGDIVWDFLSCDVAPPPQPGEDRVVDLDDTRDADEINGLARASNDRIITEAGRGEVLAWLGIRGGDGTLVAAGGSNLTPAGVPHLVGIVTHPEHRGQGLAAAVTARLTRQALDRFGVCTLGIFADNDAARRLYHRLGYRTGREWLFRAWS